MNIISKVMRNFRLNGFRRTFLDIYEYSMFAYLTKFIGLFLKNSPLEKAIIIESHNDFDCNGGAFYNYLLEHHVNDEYKIVWLLKHAPTEKFPHNVTYARLYRPSLKRAYYSWKAKYFLADCCMTPKKRKEQVSIYMTHGAIGLKSVIGKEVVHNTVDYVLGGSPNYDEIYTRELTIKPYQQILHFGFPCLDVFYHDSPNQLARIRTERYKKVILWMPTFRKGGRRKRNDSGIELPLGIPIIEDATQMVDLNRMLQSENILLILKLHPMQDPDTFKELHDYSNIAVISGVRTKELGLDIYGLVKQVDALISDYSSIAYQYILLNRPIGFVLSDVNELKSGLAVENPYDYIVGDKIYSFDDFIEFITKVGANKDEFAEKREALANWLYMYRDGKACQRLYKFLELE